jgi:hypothetical protein
MSRKRTHLTQAPQFYFFFGLVGLRIRCRRTFLAVNPFVDRFIPVSDFPCDVMVWNRRQR